MIARDRSQCVSVPVETLAQVAVAVKVLHLLMKASVGKHLVAWEREVLPVVAEPVYLEAELVAELDESRDAPQQGLRDDSLDFEIELGI